MDSFGMEVEREYRRRYNLHLIPSLWKNIQLCGNPAHMAHIYYWYLKPVFRIRIRMDKFHFGQPDPDPGSKKSAKIMENFRQDPDPLFHETNSRIRIHIKMKPIRNTAYGPPHFIF